MSAHGQSNERHFVLVKYLIAIVLVIAAGLIIWVVRTGTMQDGAIMAVAIVSVIFFASVGNLWNSMYSGKAKETKKAPISGENVVVVRSPKKDE